MARPREFDTDEALGRAMQAFWSHGYEGTSMADLMQAMGLQKGSLYKAFGDKHSLFILSIKRYLDEAHQFDVDLIEKASSPEKGLRGWFVKEMTKMCNQPLKRGCLMVNTLTELGSEDKEAVNLVKSHSAKTSKIIAKAIEAGQTENQFRKDFSANELAQIVLVSLVGMLVLIKGPMSKSASLQNVNNVLKLIEK